MSNDGARNEDGLWNGAAAGDTTGAGSGAGTAGQRPAAVVLTALRGTPLSLAEVLDAISRPGVGGTALFVGTVRDNDAEPDGAHAVSGLDYSAHPDAARVLAEVAAEVAGGAPDGTVLAVVHRTGSLAVGELAIVAAAGSAHRGAAFETCRRLVDEVKARVPIWKREHYVDGSASWVGMTR